jgi:hypothetical protein
MIDPEEVTAILLADGWHEVSAQPGFKVETYGYVGAEMMNAPGFRMVEADRPDQWLSGPLASILATRHGSQPT